VPRKRTVVSWRAKPNRLCSPRRVVSSRRSASSRWQLARELDGCRFAGVAAVPLGLLSGQQGDRQGTSPHHTAAAHRGTDACQYIR